MSTRDDKLYNLLTDSEIFTSGNGLYILSSYSKSIINYLNANGNCQYSLSGNNKIVILETTDQTELDSFLISNSKNNILVFEICDSFDNSNFVEVQNKENAYIIRINAYCITNQFSIVNNEILAITEKPAATSYNPILNDMIIKKVSETMGYNKIALAMVGAAGTGRMKSNCVVQAGPSDSYYTTIGSVNLLESVEILSKEWDWYRIRYEVGSTNTKKVGFVMISNVITSDSDKIPTDNYYGGYAYASTSININSCDDATYSVSGYGSISKLEGVTILFSEGNSYYVEYSTSTGAKRGYINRSNLVKPFATCVAIINSQTNVSSGAGTRYEVLGSVGEKEFVSILAKNGNDIYIEYNTNSGRKRGYIDYTNVTAYNRPATFNDLYTYNNNGSSGYVYDKNTVYGGPAESYASIGAVNCEDIITYDTNDSVFDMTYIEYYISGSDMKKSGYIYKSKIKNIGDLEHNHLTSLSDSYLYFGNKIKYGESQLKRALYYYKSGTGNNHLYLIFAQHGWEDGTLSGNYYHGDGDMLVRIAKYFLEQFTSSDELSISQRNQIMNNWTIFVYPCNNPDGIVNGYSNNGFGRCLYNGIDANRSWPGNFVVDTSRRNYTSGQYLNASELEALYNSLISNIGSGENVLIDIHGWQNMILTRDSNIANYYYNQFHNIHNGFYKKTPVNDSGYLIRWANNSSTTQTTSSNKKGLGAKSGLLELPPTEDYSLNNIEATYGLAFFRGTIQLLLNFLS